MDFSAGELMKSAAGLAGAAEMAGASFAQFLFEIKGVKRELRVIEFEAIEGISVPYEVNLKFACSKISPQLGFDEVAYSEAVLTIKSNLKRADLPPMPPDMARHMNGTMYETDRYFHGIISKFEKIAEESKSLIYSVQIVPRLWFLSLERDCRTFQNMRTDEIVSTVLEEGGLRTGEIDFRFVFVTSDLDERVYCNQYEESDLNFISRLMEDEGIFYWFEHTKDNHVMVIANDAFDCFSIKGDPRLTCKYSSNENCVSDFLHSHKIRPGSYAHSGYNETIPRVELEASRCGSKFQDLEIYEYSENYESYDKGKLIAAMRLQEQKTL